VASKRIPPVLAVEIEAAWPTAMPADLWQLIADMAAGIAGEARNGLRRNCREAWIRVSPRTVRRYMGSGPGAKSRQGSQAWSAFVRNHARSVLACYFFVTVTATFRILYIFVVLDVSTRRIVHWNVTDIQRRSGLYSSSGSWCRVPSRVDLSARPRQHLIRGCRSHDCGNGADGPQDAHPDAASERVLRATDRHNPACASVS